jgi:predicted cobalt transporter CbtA
MSEDKINKNNITVIHWSFWLISLLGLIWNIGGCINYIMQTNLEFVATLPETHQAIIVDRPVWATAGFAIGLFFGVIGCLLLLLRKSLANSIFIVSLIGIVMTMAHTVNVARSKIDFSLIEIFVMIILPLIVAVLLLWYSKIIFRKNSIK